MYSFLPKLSQQLGQLAKMNKNPYINNPNPPFEPPEGPGNVYKNLLEGDKERFYRNYDNKWYVAGESDGKDWKDISPEGWNEMLNNRITTDTGKQALYKQGNPEYTVNAQYDPLKGLNMPQMPNIFSNTVTKESNNLLYDENEMSYNPTASLDERTKALKYKELDKYRDEKGMLPLGIIPELGYHPYFDNQFVPGMDINQQVTLGANKILSPNDMGGAGVMKNTGPEPTTYLDQIMGNVETPYVPKYIPFTSPEEMFRAEMNVTPEPEITLDQIPTINDEKLNQFNKQQAAEALQLQAKSWMGNIFSGNNNNNPSDKVKNWMSGLFKEEPNESTEPPKNKFGLAEGYYLGNSLLNASAAINNMVQPEPPSIQMKLPHFERQRLNPEQYDAMRSQIGEQSNAAYRLQRENISQASDLMKGLAAVTSGTQQAMMNVGLNQAGAEQQIQNINQQISMQEQGLQTDTLNKEAITNWQIQDEFYKTKGQAISSALAALSQTGGQFAKYKTMQEMINKQDAINKSAAEINNEMQASLLQYELSESALSSQEYQDYYKSQRTAEQERINKELLGDEKYKAFNDYYNGVIPSYSSYQYNIDSPESQEKLRTINVAKRFQSEYPLGAAPDITKFPNDKEGYDKAVAEYNKYKAYNDRYNNDPRYKAYEAEQAFWKEALEKFNESALKKSTAETYLKSRNLPTQTEILQRLKAISERGAQSFE